MEEPFFDFGKIAGELTAEAPAAARGCSIKSRCQIGAFSYIGRGTEITRTNIGRYCSIAANVTIGPTDHPTDRFSTHLVSFRNKGPFSRSSDFLKIMKGSKPFKNELPITNIEHDVWIGANVVIKRGINIGTGAVIGAGSVVTKNVKPYEIVGGVPAKYLRKRFSDEVCERLLASEWWLYDLSACELSDVEYDNVKLFLHHVENLKSLNALKILEPVTFKYLKGTREEAMPIYVSTTDVKVATSPMNG